MFNKKSQRKRLINTKLLTSININITPKIKQLVVI